MHFYPIFPPQDITLSLLSLNHHFSPLSTGSFPKTIQMISDTSCFKEEKKKKKKNFLSLNHPPFIIPIFITDLLNYCRYSQCPTENQPAILLALVYKSISSWFKKAPYLNRISAKTYSFAKTSSGFPELVLFFIGYTTKQLRGSF